LCDFSIDYVFDRAGCSGSGGTCANAKMLTTSALPTTHPGPLKGASIAIQNILRNQIQNHNPGDGRELAFLNMGTGVMLAWVRHGDLAAIDILEGEARLQLEEAPAEEASAS
jgi:hypothetical protein